MSSCHNYNNITVIKKINWTDNFEKMGSNGVHMVFDIADMWYLCMYDTYTEFMSVFHGPALSSTGGFERNACHRRTV